MSLQPDRYPKPGRISHRAILAGEQHEILAVFCYIAAGILVLIASVLLIQVFTAPAAIENATLGYRMMLGLSGPVVDRLLSSLAGLTQAFFCLSGWAAVRCWSGYLRAGAAAGAR